MIYFEEVQYPPKAMNIILGIAMALVVFSFGAAMLLTEIDQPTTEWYDIVLPLGFLVLTMALLIIIYRSTRQHVQITGTDLRVRQSPFHRKHRVFPWTEVTTAIYRPVSPMGEFGGWGIRYNMNGVWGYVLGGDRGIELHLNNGKKRVVSVVDGQGARAALEALQQQHLVHVRFVTER